jgi:hypothetical protein
MFSQKHYVSETGTIKGATFIVPEDGNIQFPKRTVFEKTLNDEQSSKT